MPTSPWPQETFLASLDAWRARAGFKHKTEMMRAAGIDPSVHTNWGNGAQPTTDSLDKLAPVLGVAATTLYIAAGRLSPSQLGEMNQPAPPVLPGEIQDLIDLYERANKPGRDLILQQVSITVRGLSALLTEDPPRPQPRRRRTA